MDKRFDTLLLRLPAMDELRERIPGLPPYAALVLTLEPMVQSGVISSEEYLKWAAGLITARGRSLFGPN